MTTTAMRTCLGAQRPSSLVRVWLVLALFFCACSASGESGDDAMNKLLGEEVGYTLCPAEVVLATHPNWMAMAGRVRQGHSGVPFTFVPNFRQIQPRTTRLVFTGPSTFVPVIKELRLEQGGASGPNRYNASFKFVSPGTAGQAADFFEPGGTCTDTVPGRSLTALVPPPPEDATILRNAVLVCQRPSGEGGVQHYLSNQATGAPVVWREGMIRSSDLLATKVLSRNNLIHDVIDDVGSWRYCVPVTYDKEFQTMPWGETSTPTFEDVIQAQVREWNQAVKEAGVAFRYCIPEVDAYQPASYRQVAGSALWCGSADSSPKFGVHFARNADPCCPYDFCVNDIGVDHTGRLVFPPHVLPTGLSPTQKASLTTRAVIDWISMQRVIVRFPSAKTTRPQPNDILTALTRSAGVLPGPAGELSLESETVRQRLVTLYPEAGRDPNDYGPQPYCEERYLDGRRAWYQKPVSYQNTASSHQVASRDVL